MEENATILTNNELLFQDQWSSAYDVQRQSCPPSKVGGKHHNSLACALHV
jgi:hypothetical protein